MTARVAVLGASGYTGAELVRLIAGHGGMEIAALTADRKAGQTMAQVFPHLRHLDLPTLTTVDQVDLSSLDLIFVALPHGLSQALVKDLPRALKVVDLGADFRLSPADYERWYGAPHVAPDLQAEAVYGLTEFDRPGIAAARLVAGTGCNSACVQFALRPLLAAGVIEPDEIIVDLKAGVSGAGRALKENMLFAERSEDVAGYSQGGKHRHLGELDAILSAEAGRPVTIQFTPHLVPVNRGILAAAYVHGDPAAIHAALTARYGDEPFVTVLPPGEAPAMAHIQASNFVHLGVIADRRAGRAMVVSVLDNLCKGSSGQAMQNANLMLGLPETQGLLAPPIFP